MPRPQSRFPYEPAQFQKGVSGNPGGRVRLLRAPSAALAELNDCAGANPDEQIANYRAARGAKWCAADEKAVALFRSEIIPEGKNQVAAAGHVTDRLEGKVPQAMNVKSEATLTINIVPLDAMLDGKRAPELQLLEAEVVGEEPEK